MIDDIVSRAGSLTVSGVPDGADGLLLSQISLALEQARPGVPILHIARDDARVDSIEDAAKFFQPQLAVIALPAWDCLPYDRVSPNPTIVARRLEALAQLAEAQSFDRPTLVLTTVNAVTQRVPPRSLLAAATRQIKVGDTLDITDLTSFLSRFGYVRSSTVMDMGEFAVRGGIVDLFPPGQGAPLRLDFFGDVLDGVRSFDPLSQVTTGRLEGFRLSPISEVVLDAETVARFRERYLANFGAVTDADPLYEAISEGRKYQGMEHWLPLFHEELETVFDYLPEAFVSLDHLAREAFTARQDMIRDHFESRRHPVAAIGQASYKPAAPESLYLEVKEWEDLLDAREARQFSAYKVPEASNVLDFGAEQGRDFAPERSRPDINIYDALRDHLISLVEGGRRTILVAYSNGARERLGLVLADHGIDATSLVSGWSEANELAKNEVGLAVLRLENGFATRDVAVITEQDILGDRLIRRRRTSRRADNFLTEASALEMGDYVTHIDHGVGRYESLQTLEISGAPHDCVMLTYDGGDRLFVPVENIEVLSRYSSGDATVVLDKLGGHAWQHRKAGLKKRLKEMADELIKVAAARELNKAPQLPPPDGIYQEFCARFPYQETEDQERAINDVLDDLQTGRPMDRLICGDVGFGKTEVALRTAFNAAMNGYQVAVIAPTTLLARQHHKSFQERFSGLPVKIEQLSRLVSSSKAKEVREGLQNGTVDIVIGTHALLGKSIKFANLGLLVIDEEQRFGVRHKETLKALRAQVHILTLTATPIPRTLQLAMSGLRGLSLIATPPVDRLAVRTFVMPFDPFTVREALLREHYRGGQSYFVSPRIADLPEIEEFLREQVPEVKFAIAHGQMATAELEDVMNNFYDGHYDVLLSTTIIESGLDIPSVNTMIIHHADMFGLAQLYQLRGRIGRSKTRGYAYLTVRPTQTLTVDAEKRLKVLQSLDKLGAGFSLASHDLDIRGAGNLLGEEQSGHIREVGIELYQNMLEEAVSQARADSTGSAAEGSEAWSPQVSLGTAVQIPENYVSDLSVRMGLYRRIAELKSPGDIDSFAAELIDRFGSLPDSVESLLKVVAIKELCHQAGIEKLEAGPRGATVAFKDDRFANPAGMVAFLSAQKGTAKLRPDHRLVLKRGWDSIDERVEQAHDFVSALAKIATESVEQVQLS